MSRRARRTAILVAALCTMMPTPASVASAEPEDEDATGRLHLIQFNVCDQGHLTNHVCSEDWPVRRTEILNQLNVWGNVTSATFQEICESTYTSVLANKPGWTGKFYKTYDVPDSRCGTDNDWGVAFISISAPSVIITTIFGQEPNGEFRVMTCGNITIHSGFRLCSTHLSPSGPQSQVDSIRNNLQTYITSGAAVMVGGDFNINNKVSCLTGIPTKLQPLYALYYGGASTHDCGPGNGSYRDVDQYLGVSGDSYDVPTLGSAKIDYVFFNTYRFNQTGFGGLVASSYVSDHRVLRGAVTIHD